VVDFKASTADWVDSMNDDLPPSGPPSGHVAVVKRRRRVFSGFLSVDEALVSHSRHDGGTQEVLRQSLERGDSAAMALVDRRRHVIFLTEQFRFPALANGPGWLRELPAGDIRRDETAAQAAAREAFEETGFTVEQVEPVATFYASPGGSSERISVFFAAVEGLARDSVGAAAARDAAEDIALVEEPLECFFDDCRGGRIQDAKTLVAGLWILSHRARLGM
jgi:nudix-type nucleoside diphosphatase (YffH/AdpP family)